MALISQEAARLTLPRLKNRIIATNIRRGPALITSRLPCVHDSADTLKVLFESTQDIGHSLVDPFPADTSGFQTAMVCPTPNASRESIEFFLGWKQMRRFADVQEAHTFDTRFFNRQQVEINKQYQYLLFEWNDYMINGMGHNSRAMNGLEFYLDYIATNFRPEVKRYGTSNSAVTGVPQPFGLPMVRELLTTVRCGEYDGLITDLDTFNALMTLLEAAGGNTAPMLMAENFGQRVMSNGQYNGAPIIVSDHVGRAKRSFNATNAAATISINPNDFSWIGSNDLDVGRDVSASCGGVPVLFGGAATTTVLSVTDPYTFVLAVAPDTAITAGCQLDLEQTNAMYAVRFSEDDGFHFRHPTANGSVPDSVYPCLPAVCGIQELVLGHLQECPDVHRTSITLRGQFMNESVESLARLSHYDLL